MKDSRSSKVPEELVESIRSRVITTSANTERTLAQGNTGSQSAQNKCLSDSDQKRASSGENSARNQSSREFEPKKDERELVKASEKCTKEHSKATQPFSNLVSKYGMDLPCKTSVNISSGPEPQKEKETATSMARPVCIRTKCQMPENQQISNNSVKGGLGMALSSLETQAKPSLPNDQQAFMTTKMEKTHSRIEPGRIPSPNRTPMGTWDNNQMKSFISGSGKNGSSFNETNNMSSTGKHQDIMILLDHLKQIRGELFDTESSINKSSEPTSPIHSIGKYSLSDEAKEGEAGPSEESEMQRVNKKRDETEEVLGQSSSDLRLSSDNSPRSVSPILARKDLNRSQPDPEFLLCRSKEVGSLVGCSPFQTHNNTLANPKEADEELCRKIKVMLTGCFRDFIDIYEKDKVEYIVPIRSLCEELVRCGQKEQMQETKASRNVSAEKENNSNQKSKTTRLGESSESENAHSTSFTPTRPKRTAGQIRKNSPSRSNSSRKSVAEASICSTPRHHDLLVSLAQENLLSNDQDTRSFSRKPTEESVVNEERKCTVENEEPEVRERRIKSSENKGNFFEKIKKLQSSRPKEPEFLKESRIKPVLDEEEPKEEPMSSRSEFIKTIKSVVSKPQTPSARNQPRFNDTWRIDMNSLAEDAFKKFKLQ